MNKPKLPICRQEERQVVPTGRNTAINDCNSSVVSAAKEMCSEVLDSVGAQGRQILQRGSDGLNYF